MSKSSINFQGVKASSEIHNEREASMTKEGKSDQKLPDYVRKDLIDNNDHYVIQRIHQRGLIIREKYKKMVGRNMPSNSKPIREAVMNLEEHHTIEDCRRVAARLERELNVDVFQIHIHRDEGRWVDPKRENITLETKTPHIKPQPNAVWLPNYHAHLVADWTNSETGKSIDLKKNDLREMQTIVSQELEMERGRSSSRKHLDPLTYKIEQRGKELEKLLNMSMEKLEVTEKGLLGKNRVNQEATIELLKQTTKDQKLLLTKFQKEIKELKNEQLQDKKTLKRFDEVRLKVQRSFQVIFQTQASGKNPDLSQFTRDVGSLFMDELRLAKSNIDSLQKGDKGKEQGINL
ncbi:hypothetical protein SAMN05421640_3207 [Ekhidna lutea]|uniref:Mobilization protein n=1 Tax=Ekhidna lutea TaxID=447679 RepID=A0A239LH35_EKHLU|nr:hypothetical protein [Ekhidna lutea]SNT28864.1 hypothetical protein SAMN05421640_3207 [Ekhidna lutea]